MIPDDTEDFTQTNLLATLDIARRTLPFDYDPKHGERLLYIKIIVRRYLESPTLPRDQRGIVPVAVPGDVPWSTTVELITARHARGYPDRDAAVADIQRLLRVITDLQTHHAQLRATLSSQPAKTAA